MTTMTEITEASLSLFISLANDAENWSGEPLIDITISRIDIGGSRPRRSRNQYLNSISLFKRFVPGFLAGVKLSVEPGCVKVIGNI